MINCSWIGCGLVLAAVHAAWPHMAEQAPFVVPRLIITKPRIASAEVRVAQNGDGGKICQCNFQTPRKNAAGLLRN
jgi:hypothetical protein